MRTIVQTIAKMGDELKRNFYIKQVAEKYKLYESTLYREMEKVLGAQRRETKEKYSSQSTSYGRRPNDGVLPEVVAEISSAEKDLIHAMLDGGEEVVKLIFEHLHTEDFTHPHSKRSEERRVGKECRL